MANEVVKPKHSIRVKRLVIGVSLAVAVVLLAAGFMVWRMNYVPANLDFSTARASEHGLFKVTIKPGIDPIPINQIHTWTLHVETPQGQPVENATIAVNGDMPQHGHGLPTKPEVGPYLGNGDYQVDGMKFQMTGWWVVDFDITAAGQTDRASFNLLLK
jgi:hypothetical protein